MGSHAWYGIDAQYTGTLVKQVFILSSHPDPRTELLKGGYCEEQISSSCVIYDMELQKFSYFATKGESINISIDQSLRTWLKTQELFVFI